MKRVLCLLLALLLLPTVALGEEVPEGKRFHLHL